MYTAAVRAAAVTERDIFLPSFSSFLPSEILFSSVSDFSLSIRRSAVVPNISASLKRLAAVGEEAPDSHFVTACRLTPTSSARASWDSPPLCGVLLFCRPFALPPFMRIIADRGGKYKKLKATCGCLTVFRHKKGGRKPP